MGIVLFGQLNPYLFPSAMDWEVVKWDFSLRSSTKCKSENGDYRQPSLDYLKSKRICCVTLNIAFTFFEVLLWKQIPNESRWKNVKNSFCTKQRTFIISNGKITKVYNCYCSIFSFFFQEVKATFAIFVSTRILFLSWWNQTWNQFMISR